MYAFLPNNVPLLCFHPLSRASHNRSTSPPGFAQYQGGSRWGQECQRPSVRPSSSGVGSILTKQPLGNGVALIYFPVSIHVYTRGTEGGGRSHPNRCPQMYVGYGAMLVSPVLPRAGGTAVMRQLCLLGYQDGLEMVQDPGAGGAASPHGPDLSHESGCATGAATQERRCHHPGAPVPMLTSRILPSSSPPWHNGLSSKASSASALGIFISQGKMMQPSPPWEG